MLTCSELNNIESPTPPQVSQRSNWWKSHSTLEQKEGSLLYQLNARKNYVNLTEHSIQQIHYLKSISPEINNETAECCVQSCSVKLLDC